jgi:hypothetical protein
VIYFYQWSQVTPLLYKRYVLTTDFIYAWFSLNPASEGTRNSSPLRGISKN